MRAFIVTRPGDRPMYLPHLERPICVDTLFYSDRDSITVEEVRSSLIDHDGYPYDIIVAEAGGSRIIRRQ